MEKRLNKKIELYVSTFKDEIRNKIMEIQFEETEKIHELMEFVYEYNRLTLEKDDFSKRKRLQNAIPVTNRCSAKRANGDQCTRRRRDDSEYCGTHYKSAPHGLMGDGVDGMVATEDDVGGDGEDWSCAGETRATEGRDQPSLMNHRLEVVAEEICGIVYYLDKYGNVYRTEDILKGKDNPDVIAKYVKVSDKYTIPELGLA